MSIASGKTQKALWQEVAISIAAVHINEWVLCATGWDGGERGSFNSGQEFFWNKRQQVG